MICRFASAQGGTIYIGKDDNGNVTGISDAKKLMEDIPNKVKNFLGTKEKFETVLTESEEKCALISCIEDSHEFNVAEVPMYNQYREFGLKLKNSAIVYSYIPLS